MSFSSAYLLLAHGSRDVRTTVALTQLAQSCQRQMEKQAICRMSVETAYLELADQPIGEQINRVAQQAMRQGCRRVKILPLFLAPGVHVTVDLPAVVATAQAELSGQCELELLTYVGASPGLLQLLQEYAQQLPRPQIFLAHGSRQPTATEFSATLATHLGATLAYWSCPPSLSEQIVQLASQEPAAIGILPYFLFPGRISTAITAAINELQSRFPAIQFRSAALLGTDPRFVNLLVELLMDTNI